MTRQRSRLLSIRLTLAFLFDIWQIPPLYFSILCFISQEEVHRFSASLRKSNWVGETDPLWNYLIFSPFFGLIDPKIDRKTNTIAHLINKAYVGDGEKKNKSQRSEKFGTDDIFHLANCSEARTSSDTDATEAFQMFQKKTYVLWTVM